MGDTDALMEAMFGGSEGRDDRRAARRRALEDKQARSLARARQIAAAAERTCREREAAARDRLGMQRRVREEALKAVVAHRAELARPLCRWLRHTSPAGHSGCWLWPHGVDAGGYARVLVRQLPRALRDDWRLMTRAGLGPSVFPRLGLLRLGAKLVSPLCMRHTCGHKRCVNPAHLTVTTHWDACWDAMEARGEGSRPESDVRSLDGLLNRWAEEPEQFSDELALALAAVHHERFGRVQ